MANASLILEIALLLLVAFLAGCAIGWLARRLTRRRRNAAAAQGARPAPPAAAATPLVAAPQVRPLFQRAPGPTAEQRLRAAAGAPSAPPAQPDDRQLPAAPAALAAIAPAPEPAPRTQRLPAHTAGEVAAIAPPAADPADASPSPRPDPEVAARQAVEGGWTPPRRLTPAPFPEPAVPDLPATPPAPETADAAVADAGAAVAAARAAAAAALDETRAPEPPPPPAPPPPAPIRRRFGAPPLLDAPRAGGSDDLTAIRGVTPALQAALNGLGIFHYDQVAGWDGKAAVWVDGQLGLRGRIVREKWPESARRLAVRARPGRQRR